MKKTLIIIVSFIIIICVLSSILLFLKKDKPIISLTDDEIRFKEEYEKLNGVEYNNTKLMNINIIDDNNIKYVKNNGIINLLINGSNIIYFGSSECNSCRNIIPILIDIIKSNDIDTLYYYNYNELDLTNEEELKINNDLIDFIGEKELDQEKEIIIPIVVFIKNGNIIGKIDNNIDLNKEQLKKQISDYIEVINANVCSTNTGC